MALEKMVSDLSNFKTKGDVGYDKLDGQMKNGVDYFPDNTSGAKGFTPSTDLLTKYNKFMKDVRQNNTLPNRYEGQSNLLAPNVGVRTNVKTKTAYGTQGEYSEQNGAGLSIFPTHINPNDNQLGIRLQPKFTSDFMATPLADYVSVYNPPTKESVTLIVAKKDDTSFPANWTFDDTQRIPSATTTPFNNQVNFTSRYDHQSIAAGSLTLTLPKETFRKSSEAGASNVDTFRSIFSVDTIKSIYNDSSDIEELFEFRNNNFNNVPSGMDDNNVQSFSDFRTVANRGPHEGNNVHPIILRRPSLSKENQTNWDNYLNEKGIISEGGFFEGALSAFGLLTRTSRDLADKQRIGTYLLSDPGKLFIAKQFAFQALNPTIESKIFNPLSTLGIAGASDLLSGNPTQALGGILRAAGSFLFPTHVERHLPNIFVKNVSRYDQALELAPYEEGKHSRLAFQSKAFSLDIVGTPDVSTGNTYLDEIANRAMKDASGGFNDIAKAGVLALSNPNRYAFPISSAPKSLEGGRPSFIGTIDLAKTDVIKATGKRGGTFNKETKDGDKIPGGDGDNLIKRHSTFSYEGLKHGNRYERHLMSPSEMNDATFRSKADTKIDTNNLAVRVTNAFGTDEPGEAIFQRHEGMKINEGIGDVKGFHKVKLNPVLGNIKGTTKSSNVDKVNILPYGLDYDEAQNADVKDFIKFRFKDVVNNKFIIFRAILEGITDTVTPEYSEDRYIGRPDKHYVYQGVDRSISFTFSIYPKTKQEFPVLIEKLNYLVGLCYPTFSATERMITPFMNLTMGDMFNETPGILRGLTITVEENSTWEIDEGLQFPHFIKAACEFTHIGKHVPTGLGKHYDLPTNRFLTPPIGAFVAGEEQPEATL